jgi:hypothetical protein
MILNLNNIEYSLGAVVCSDYCVVNLWCERELRPEFGSSVGELGLRLSFIVNLTSVARGS